MNNILPQTALNELGLSNVHTEATERNKKSINYVMITSVMLLSSLVSLVANNDIVAVAVMDKAPEGVNYPDVQPTSVYNIENNTRTNINIFSKEHLDNVAKEQNLKVTYFDTPENQAINLAFVEKTNKTKLDKVEIVNVEKQETIIKPNILKAEKLDNKDITENLKP